MIKIGNFKIFMTKNRISYMRKLHNVGSGVSGSFGVKHIFDNKKNCSLEYNKDLSTKFILFVFILL